MDAHCNYFKVKNVTAFQEWAAARDLCTRSIHNEAEWTIFPAEGCLGCWPACWLNENTEEYEDFDILQELSTHLEEGSIAIIWQVYEKPATGWAEAVNSNGETVRIDLEDILNFSKILNKQ